MTRWTSQICGPLVACAIVLGFTLPGVAEDPVANKRSETSKLRPASKKLASSAAKPPAEKSTSTTSSSGSVDSPHPLEWALAYARSNAKHIRENIDDYSCRLIKRERINGRLQSYQFANVLVRCEKREDGRIVRPMALFMRFLAPAKIKDRRVLYVDGENDGKVLIRKGGQGLKYLRLELDPNGSAARRESNYPITELGFNKIIDRLIDITTDDIEYDPTGENTRVSRFGNAKVGKRVCTHIQVEHPEAAEGMQFHRASLFIDDELRVPIRLVVYGWPENEDEKPPLMEEYMYTDLQLNVGLTDDAFGESKLE